MESVFGTDSMTEEECGRKPEMQYNLSDLCRGWIRDATPEYVFAFLIIVSCRPHSSPDPFGATLPPGEGIILMLSPQVSTMTRQPISTY